MAETQASVMVQLAYALGRLSGRSFATPEKRLRSG